MSSSKSAKKPVYNNFLEALQDLGKGIVRETVTQAKQAVVSDIPSSFGLTAGGTLNPNESFSISEQLKAAESRGETRAETQFNQRLVQMREEERARLLRSEAQVKEQVKAIQEEIRLLAKSAGDLAHEVEIAAAQAPVNPGVYHRNFFSQLRGFLVILRKQVQESRHWLATTNSRAAKKGAYWGNVAKSGTKYMLSSERYMVTSTG